MARAPSAFGVADGLGRAKPDPSAGGRTATFVPRPAPRIALDAMASDHGPGVLIDGGLRAARGCGLSLILVGDRAVLERELASRDVSGLNVSIHHASEVVGMDEKPSEAIRRKKDSSILSACRLVKDGMADGVVSAGNSGASMAAGLFVLGRVKGVERPALASIMPTGKGRPVVLCDVGANVDCKPSQLFQFGLMAEILSRDILRVERPRVGLLSIGEEEGKGNVAVKEAFDLLKASKLNFIGNVEGRDIFSGDVDVVVCDGFVGNVALKLSEGLAMTLVGALKAELTGNLWTKIGTWIVKPALRRFANLVDYAEYGGAPLLGLKGPLFVCHGKSNAKSIASALTMAATYAASDAHEHLLEGLSQTAVTAEPAPVPASSASTAPGAPTPSDATAAAAG